MGRPPSGSMCWWRFKGAGPYRFGYCTYVSGHDLVRMGANNGDTTFGSVVSVNEIEWRPYK